VVSFVWGPGQATPVHDHLVWGVIGVLRGAEMVENFEADAQGRIARRGEPEVLGQGGVAFVSPAIGDVHRVRNAFEDRVSVSIHVYGANIGAVRRFVYGLDGRKAFVSGYANAPAS
jgi:predicted metal-dependent enzyme (double-stranded beta helix superfamily)